MARTDWRTVSGLADDLDGYIVKSRFGYREGYNDNQGSPVPLLIWDVESPDVDDQTIIWSIGKGWEIAQDGLTVSPSATRKGKKTEFTDTAMIGRLINRVANELKIPDSTSIIQGKPTSAVVWEEHGFHFKREKIAFSGGAERGIRESVEHLMPVAYLGLRGKKQTATVTTQNDGAVDDQVTRKLVKLAKTMDDVDKFQRAALKMEEVADDPTLLNKVMDAGDTGFWSRSRRT